MRVRIGAAEGGHSTVRVESGGLTLYEGVVATREEAEIAARDAVPEFMCHYYNYYFAHTAGGRMIGKQMSALLLNKKTLEFYKVRETYSVLFVCGFVWVVWTVRWDLGVEYVSFIILCIANLFLFSLFDSLYRITPLRTCTDLINRQLTNGNTT